MKISVEIDDSVYNFLERRGISVSRLLQMFVLRCEHLLKTTNSKKKLIKELDYMKISNKIEQVAMDLDREDRKRDTNAKAKAEEMKSKRMKSKTHEEFI